MPVGDLESLIMFRYLRVEILEANELTKDLNVKLNKQKVKGSKNRKAQINNFKNYIYSVRAFD